jgi:murein DD-endopeptidase MepM/ murein hydrolase activator NlpD
MRNNKEKKHSTVIITDKYSHETKVFNINQKHIANFRLYKRVLLGLACGLILLLTGLLSFIVREHFQKVKLNTELAALKNDLQDAASKEALKNNKIQQMWNKLNLADSTLQKIEKYLDDRNVAVFSSKGNNNNVGGKYYPADKVNFNLIQQRTNEITNILETLQSVPLGLPHEGNFTSDFGVRGNPMSNSGFEFHPGLDISGNTGEPLYATANGTVVFADVKGGYGKCVIIKHIRGYETLYGHLSKILVRKGDKIQTGTIIGLLGSTGRSTGPHVHYEVILNNEKQNPIEFLSVK